MHRLPAIVCLIIASVHITAHGQHAGFVLFGAPDPGASEVPASHRFVHPVTSPYFHEDSFVTTDVRAWYLYHDFPKSSAIGGGHAKVAAAQIRLALTKDLQLVAYKDGYADFQTGLVNDEGLMDIAAGLKWNFYRNWEKQLHLAAGVGYEFGVGTNEVLQDDDEWRFWGSVNKGFDAFHLGATLNYFYAPDKSDALGNSDRLSWHVHADYYLCEWFSPVVEFNGYHTIDEGNAALTFSGVDVANLGGGKGEDVVTMGVGGAFRLCDRASARVAYEFPLTQEDDLFGYRWTFSVVIGF